VVEELMDYMALKMEIDIGHQFVPFWWPDLPDNGGLMAFCVGEILSWRSNADRN
jgi:hypothetical protein